MELLPGFRMRPPHDEDADEVADFSNAESLAFIGVRLIDSDWIRARWTAPGVDREPWSSTPPRLRTSRGSALLSSRGYREVRRFELRRVDFAGEPAPPPDVEGISVRGFRPEEGRQLYEAHVEAFADHWGEGTETYESFRHHQFDAPEFDPGLWFVAWDGEALVGYVGAQEKSREDPSHGYIGLLAVRRPYRRRGLGEALALHAFRALHARGLRGAELHVDADSLTGATGLYAKVGMTAHPRFATWEKELRPGLA